MDAVGEEHALGIDQEVCVFRGGFVNSFGGQDGFQGVAHAEVLLAVLVPENVTAVLGGFGQVEGVLLLLKGEVFPTGDLVTHDLEVCKGINGILEIALACVVAGGEACGYTCHRHHLE